MTSSTDRIERSIVLKAPVARVWHALSDAASFGSWFGVKFDDGVVFAPGAQVRGHVTYPGYEHVVFEAWIEQMESQRRLSWRWHPAAVERGRDYSDEPTTLVVFELQPADGGTLLTVVESGFDQIPPRRRLEAFRMNSGGWDEQMRNIAGHVDHPA
ncbi:SRPBCC family protein [Cupriavidus numazuensis]|uniref:Activator of Hsp90 ATPase homologue 1/2-like C-terminal domain-containing protein n=1 Tax=Cupriavidus numazuensis TaxID=221992 RepID=A0ABM8TQF0_9BURK|nr:SRPBCC family protein [Cupriavidus numazuensis]CAG2158112.1 hypothetical protein LMG26411_05842 [Cupriavidus numazuensis]